MEEVDIVNAALQESGSKRITTLDSTTPAGVTAGDIYTIKRDLFLQSHPWNFADTRARLPKYALAPPAEWDHAYQLPSDWLRTLAVADNSDMFGAVDYRQSALFTSERILNGDFAVSTGWSGTNWAFGSGGAVHTPGSTAALSRTAVLTASTTFRVSFEISNMTDGESITPSFSGGVSVVGGVESTNDFHAQEITADSGGNTQFNLVPSTGFDGTVDNVSCIRISGDASAHAIMTDADDIWIRYVRRVTDVDLMTMGFRQGLIYLLAKVFSTKLASSNTLRQITDVELKEALRIAKSVDGSEDFPGRLNEGSWANSRGGWGWSSRSTWPL